MSDKVRWGILSTAKIGTLQVIPAMQKGRFCEVTAMASRNQERAHQVATELGIPHAYGSYEELLADPNIDAIYNPLPNHMHVPWSIKAIEAGKHVLCEKPIGLSAVEGQQLLDCAAAHPELKVMEAFMYRHHPQWQRAKNLVQEGKIGTLRTIQSFFSYFNDDPQNIRNQSDIGGGGLMDIGCYPISLSRFIFDGEPQRVSGIAEYDSKLGTDQLASATLDFENGTSTFTCSTQLNPYQRVQIHGTTGRIEIEIPFNAPIDCPCKIWLQTGDEIEEIELELCNQYTIQGDLMSQAILNDSPVPTPLSDAIRNMRVIEAIFESHRSGNWIAP
ncbi:Gfo/Idh/MocA family protein [Gimesia fumaroli]|uniref:Glucose--fructose oxidoreductase n=1 Tax=Gimesia fumaroli TaxID=2527976 RepID=A0A518IKI8_9PLAN|nr:Gfo/Idh/MocA family oxidoreductase [Gimesia fumaroli]QDV53608.1 Glucose--fructose oxidoreductase precursor [Gimesia fumaroli]